MNLIVKLCWVYRFREVAYRFPHIAWVLLREHFSDYPVKSVGLDLGQECRVVVYKQRCCSQELLKL
jgi:hypothetical protein